MIRRMLLIPIWIAIAQPARSAESVYQWRRILPPGKGVWPEKCEPTPSPTGSAGDCLEGGWPLASVPVVGSGNQLWMPQNSRNVWHSADGSSWKRSSSDGGWGQRYGAVPAFFRGKLWLFGGADQDRRHRNDGWCSADGRSWTLTAASAPWPGRRGHAVVVFRDELWLLGGADGEKSFNDVWHSGDGAAWKPALEHAPWTARAGHAALFHRDRLWVIGGGGWEAARADVWSSPDGLRWTEVTPQASWPLRVFPGAAVLEGRMWIFGGSTPKPGLTPHDTWLHDVWFSEDGAEWKLATAHAPWTPRDAEHCVVFNGKLWLFGGKGIEEDGRGGYASDVWCMASAAATGEGSLPPKGN